MLRKHDKYGIWLGVGGHVELDEDPNQAAIREVMEEVGLEIELVAPKDFTGFKTKGYQELLPPVFVNRHRINDEHEHITYAYFATSLSDNVTPESPDDKWRWLTKKELEANEALRPNVKHYALAALAATT